MPQFNMIAVKRSIRNYPEPYYTRTGRTLIADKAFNDKGEYLGFVVRCYTNDWENENPMFIKFVPKGFEQNDYMASRSYYIKGGVRGGKEKEKQ